jgi:hypothetical protein
MRKLLTLVLAVAGLALLASSAQAQVNNAAITATATVQTPINVTAANNLDFGNVFPGVSKAIAVGDATAGRWDVTGQASTAVTLNFTLPTDLVFGANLLPIGTWTGNHNTTATPTGTSFTPSGAPEPSMLSGTGQLFVYIGATVSPAVNQAAGVYSASVTLTVLY